MSRYEHAAPPGSTRALILVSSAAWGFGVAAALTPLWQRAPSPDQLAGFMKSHGLDANGPVYQVAALVVLPILAALLARLAIPYFERAGTQRWAIHAAAGAFLLGLWGAFVSPPPFALIVLAPIGSFIALIFLRNVRARFSRKDILLIAVWLTVFFALVDLWRSLGYTQTIWLSAAIVLAMRIALLRFASVRESPSKFFVFSPLGLPLLIRAFGLDPQVGGGLALAIAILSPLLVIVLRLPERRARWIVAFVTYPIFVLSYSHVTNLAEAEGLFRASLFEEGHGLMPANEMLRGETLYRDVSPGHGALADGVLDYLAIRFGNPTLGDVLSFRAILGSLTPVAIYAIAAAASGSAELGMLAFLFTAAWIRNTTLLVRPVPSLFALFFMIRAVRLRRRRDLIWAGALLVVSLVTSIDFAMVAGLTMIVVLLCYSRSWREKGRAAISAAIGFFSALLVLLIVLAGYGILGDYFRVTFREVLILGPAYSIGFVSFPDSFMNVSSFPEALSLFFDPPARPYLGWALVAVGMAAAFAYSPLNLSRRTAGAFLIGCWVLAAGISYAERHHHYYNFVLPALLIVTTFLLWRWGTAWSRTIAVVAALAMAITAHPTTNLTVSTIVRISSGPLDPNFAEYPGAVRAQGALMRGSDFPKLDAVGRFLTTLGPDETFLDMANLPLLYFLFDKPAPIRQFEVPFFSPEALQREVVERLERDRSIRAVLIAVPVETNLIDGVPNSERVPIVWKYIQEHFEPAFEEGGVMFWIRKDG